MSFDWPARRATLSEAAWPIAQTAVGAGLAWAIARYALGHKQPFFAPIAASVSLGASRGRRGRQAVQAQETAAGVVEHALGRRWPAPAPDPDRLRWVTPRYRPRPALGRR